MFGQHFYHKQIRKTVIAFGTIFNNINIKRTDSSGNPIQTIRVPLSYAPKEKFIARLDQNADLTGDDSSVAITLPRMSFDITGYSYDATRKLNKNQKISVTKNTSGDNKTTNTQFSPVPYDVAFDLSRRIDIIQEIDGIWAEVHPTAYGLGENNRKTMWWNKLGYPDWVHSRYGGEFWDAFLYWWYDEEAATKLKSAMSNDQNLPIDPIEIKFWPAYKVNNL